MLSDLTTRATLMGSLPHGGIGVEIGVQGGDFAQDILANNEPDRLFLVDCWEHQSAEVYGHDPANVADHTNLLLYKQCIDRFQHLRNVHVLRAYSLDAAAFFADDFFDWVYFDANHLMLAEDLDAWGSKLKKGGWCCGHDYCNVGDYISVKQVVDETVRRLGVNLHVTQEPGYPAWAYQTK